MKVSELSGALLDYWTARADESWKWAHELFPTMTLDPKFSSVTYDPEWRNGYGETVGACVLIPNNPFRQDRQLFRPSTDWEHGGRLIERERINIVTKSNPDMGGNDWIAMFPRNFHARGWGRTPLIAAMRAFVASKFGDEVSDATE